MSYYVTIPTKKYPWEFEDPNDGDDEPPVVFNPKTGKYEYIGDKYPEEYDDEYYAELYSEYVESCRKH